MKIVSIVGNRPQFVKSAPLSLALRSQGIDEVVVHTGQHYDRELSEVFFEEARVSRSRCTGSICTPPTLPRWRPRSARSSSANSRSSSPSTGIRLRPLAGARAATVAGIALAHVEAGLRSGDLTMPEEHTRIEVDALSAYLFCPDERSADTLRA